VLDVWAPGPMPFGRDVSGGVTGRFWRAAPTPCATLVVRCPSSALPRARPVSCPGREASPRNQHRRRRERAPPGGGRQLAAAPSANGGVENVLPAGADGLAGTWSAMCSGSGCRTCTLRRGPTSASARCGISCFGPGKDGGGRFVVGGPPDISAGRRALGQPCSAPAQQHVPECRRLRIGTIAPAGAELRLFWCRAAPGNTTVGLRPACTHCGTVSGLNVSSGGVRAGVERRTCLDARTGDQARFGVTSAAAARENVPVRAGTTTVAKKRLDRPGFVGLAKKRQP